MTDNSRPLVPPKQLNTDYPVRSLAQPGSHAHARDDLACPGLTPLTTIDFIWYIYICISSLTPIRMFLLLQFNWLPAQFDFNCSPLNQRPLTDSIATTVISSVSSHTPDPPTMQLVLVPRPFLPRCFIWWREYSLLSRVLQHIPGVSDLLVLLVPLPASSRFIRDHAVRLSELIRRGEER